MATSTRRRTKQPTQRQIARHQQVAELSQQLKAYAESLDPAQQAEYAARFDHYSPRNALLIVMQRPDATVVRGFRAWREEGRKVRKGEHGIQILAPAGQIEIDDGGGSRRVQQDDQPHEVGSDSIRRLFRLAYVFDISQTEPLAPGEPVNDIEWLRYLAPGAEGIEKEMEPK